jgi:transposase InsO family protein
MLDEAERDGIGRDRACKQLGVTARTVQRWRRSEVGDDLRSGPRTRPRNALSKVERRRVLEAVNRPEYRDLSPKQIVPDLADKGTYLASESTMYRLLRAEDQLAHRGRAKVPSKRTVEEHVASAPNQVWAWDITYLKTTVRGRFFYLYLVEDVFSRKITGWNVHEHESAENAAKLVRETCQANEVDPEGLVLHSDNGSPMKGSTMLATLQRLGIVPSFSRPGVSDDNPHVEALFRTLKYRPEYPGRPFATIEEARAWVAGFVAWYNGEHRHSAIRFVTPAERHSGRESQVLAHRRRVYEQARRRHPERWAGSTRNWTPIGPVYLNPERRDGDSKATAA